MPLSSSSIHNSSYRSLFVLIPLTFFLFFFRLGSWAFFDADEGRYGAIPREMIINGDYVTPTLNHIEFFDKPPLLYWGIAASYKLFGFSEAAARLVPALAALSGVVFVWLLGRHMFNQQTGLLAAIILSTSLMWPVLARIVVTDMLVSALLFIALGFWWMGHTEIIPKKQKIFNATFWIVLALAVLAKGPVNLVLTGGCIMLYCLLQRRFDALKFTFYPVGIALFFVIVAPWFIIVALRNPEFNYYFWYDQHFARFFGNSISGADHIQGFDYFLKLIPVILFPWSVFIPAAIFAGIKAWKQPPSPRHRAGIFLLSIIGFILAFYSSSSSKLITYLLPILPPVAILLAAYFDRQLYRESQGINAIRTMSYSTFFLALLVLGGALFAGWRGASRAIELGVNYDLIIACNIVLMLWGLALTIVAWRHRIQELLIVVAGGFTAALIAALFIVSSIAPQFTTPLLITYIQSGIRAGAEVDTLPFTQSIGFYSQRRVKMLGSPSELSYGIDQLSITERRSWVIEDTSKLEHMLLDLRLSTPAYFIVRKNKTTNEILSQLPTPPIRIIENKRFVVIGNQAAAAITPPHRP